MQTEFRRKLWLLLPVLVLVAAGLSAAIAAAPSGDTPYVALGDSFAAGPLVPPADPDATGCMRSESNYPQLLAARYQITNFRDVTCSGAGIHNIVLPQAVHPGPNPPQLAAVDAGTRLVTLQIGGNDIGFAELVENCFALVPLGTPCRDRYAPGGVDEISARIRNNRPRMDGVLAAIKARAPQATIYVLGYPSLLPEDLPGCWPLMPYAPADVPYLVGIQKELNAMLSESAAANGAHYVDVYTPSLGRDSCRLPAERWVEPLVLPSSGAPIHPNLQGMIGMEAAIAAVVDATLP